MKESRVYAILGAVYLAPHVTKWVGIGVGVYMVLCMFCAMWKEAD